MSMKQYLRTQEYLQAAPETTAQLELLITYGPNRAWTKRHWNTYYYKCEFNSHSLLRFEQMRKKIFDDVGSFGGGDVVHEIVTVDGENTYPPRVSGQILSPVRLPIPALLHNGEPK